MEHERLYSKLNYSWPSIGMNTLVTYALRAYISKIHIYISTMKREQSEEMRWEEVGRRDQKKL